MISSKELTKLAAACRKAGITSFTSAEFSFTLSDMVPAKATKKAKSAAAKDFTDTAIEAEDTWESLSDEEKLFYSVNPGALEESNEQ